jgi:DNA (cytosine-5)-methyltransferase 1
MITATDLFCGAGGSSLGAETSGIELVMAANHWQTAIDVHQSHFPNAGHDVADISAADPRRYPITDVLLASPECTNHSQARGVSRKKQDPTLWDQPDPAAVKSRATMWDVPRFAEQNKYSAIVVENVVEATKWVNWQSWCMAMDELGYTRTVLSHNSMHHGVAQSRDRIYVVFTRNGINVDLEREVDGWCGKCERSMPSRQAWKNGRIVGRYKTQWVWACTTCGSETTPGWVPASTIIDWDLECPRIGDRKRPLAANTRKRILAGLRKHGWAPVITAGAGNTHERTPGNRSKPVTDPLPTQQTTLQSALAQPPGFMVQTAHGGRLHEVVDPHPTVCASDDRLSLVVTTRGTSAGQIAGSTKPTTDALGTVSAGGMHHGLLVSNNANNVPRPTSEPASTVTTGNRHALLMRNNTDSGRGEMTTPVTEPARTMTVKGHQSLVDPAALADDCGFRMLEPNEVAAAMAFPENYIPRDLTKRDQVKLAGNGVTPPVMEWITGRIVEALAA